MLLLSIAAVVAAASACCWLVVMVVAGFAVVAPAVNVARAAGIVESVGAGVTTCAVGDHVIPLYQVRLAVHSVLLLRPLTHAHVRARRRSASRRIVRRAHA